MFEGLSGKHSCEDIWSVVDGEEHILVLRELIPILQSREPILLPHNQIAYWWMQSPTVKKRSKRYDKCDISVPGIVAEGVKNPFNLPFRMVDGSHRMAKMKLETQIKESYFYVITENEFYEHLTKVG